MSEQLNSNKKFMNTRLILLLATCFLPFSLFSKTEKNKKNGFDSSQWEYVIKDKTLDPAKVFSFENNVLKISGISSGYIRTKKMYKNYDLSLEWRWTQKFGNSGVLVHIQPKDTIWPVCYQVQQKAHAAGDIICMNGFWAKECTDSVKFTVAKKLDSNEKKLGEWNTMKILCRKNKITVYINGVLQNEITGLTSNKGFIGFQNEGTPLEFRNIKIKN